MTNTETTTIALITKLQSLGFNCKLKTVVPGPVITNYFLEPDMVAPLSKILSKQEEIAMAVKTESLLIQRQGGLICVSIPNRERTIINFDKCVYWLVTSSNTEYKLPLLMGCDPVGQYFSIDLTVQPHILIAGSTGSGKSVYLSQLIASLVMQKSPKELKFLLVDTKQVDLTLFSDLPHVVKTITTALQLHEELNRLLTIVRQRTNKLKGLARNINEYNTLVSPAQQLPYYVLVIDELADVLLQDKALAKTEDKDTKRLRISAKLTQLAAISRASGVHIIAATQRPSASIISGDFKTNFPTRISFKLPTSQDSRVILDENGAESLLGKGDYLYITADSNGPQRAHSAFVTMADIVTVTVQHDAIREQLQAARQVADSRRLSNP